MDGQKLKNLRLSKNLQQKELADILNVDLTLVSKWEKHNVMPNRDTFVQLCDFFNVTADHLLGRSNSTTEMSIARGGQQNAFPVSEERLKFLEQLHKSDNNVEPIQSTLTVQIPVYGEIPAGKPVEACEDILEYIDIPADWTKGGQEFFGLQVKGESMLPDFKNGDTIVLKKQPTCETGKFCAISLNGSEVTFKRVRRQENGITLQPLNPDFDPMFFTNKQIKDLPITILGVVVEGRRKF